MNDDNASNSLIWWAPNNQFLARSLDAESKVNMQADVLNKYSQQLLRRSKVTDQSGCVKVLEEPKRYVPGKGLFGLKNISNLNSCEHAVCVKALMKHQTGIETWTQAERIDDAYYLERSNIIKNENAQFLKLAQSEWDTHMHMRSILIKPHFQDYALKLWKNCLKRVRNYSRYYSSFEDQINIPIGNIVKVEVKHIEEVFWIGNIGLFIKPIFLKKQALQLSNIPPVDDFLTYNSKLPVSQDENIKEFIDTHDFQVVISSSGLKRLTNDADFDMSWDIPVTIKKYGKKKILYVDKPVTKRDPTVSDLKQKCFKRLIKTQYCQNMCVSSPTVLKKRINPNFSVDLKKRDRGCTISERAKIIDDCRLLQSNSNKNVEKRKRARSEPRTHSFKPVKNNYKEEPSVTNNKLPHCATYRIWSIKPAEYNIKLKMNAFNQEIKFLVRCNLDAYKTAQEVCSNGYRAVILEPKLEFQSEFGATISTKSEINNHWIKMFFRPSSELCRVRLTNHNAEILSFEKVEMMNLMKEAESRKMYSPALRLGVLHTIFTTLLKLEEGSYLLHHKSGPFLEVLKTEESFDANVQLQTKGKGKVYDFHDTYDEQKCVINSDPKISWMPLDVNYILPQHEIYKRMPGLFMPSKKRIATTKTKKAKRPKRLDWDAPPSK